MKTMYKSEQTGRSMVEMLVVLAIIGVLSVGGIAGYSKAMTKFKINKSMDQISMLVANIRTLFSGQRSYSGLNNTNAVDFGIIPSEMDGGGGLITNAFSGGVSIAATDVSVGGGTTKNGGFTIKYSGLGKEACVTMATSDWGSGSSSGLVSMSVSATDAAGTTYSGTDLPVTLINAADKCGCDTPVCSITWTYL